MGSRTRALLATAFLSMTTCDQLPVSASPEAVSQAAGCPDTSSVAAIAKTDWAATFGLEAELAARLKSGLSAAVELRALAARLDADLKVACGGLARDLGAGGDFATGEQACKAAMTAMADLRGKMGAQAKLALAFEPPRCAATFDAMADCMAQCETEFDPGKAELTCEGGTLEGRCEAQCSGSCHLEAAAKCEGTCKGSCSAQFSGTCGGACNGTCDGQAMKGGHCAGTCEGSCSAAASGSCGGQCEGTCELAAAAQCQGTCSGSCSVEMKEPRCTGEIKPPKASAECQAQCDAHVQAEVQCTPGRVALDVQGSVDTAAAAKYRAAIEKNLPLVLNVAVGMRQQVELAAKNTQAVVGGLDAAVKGAGSAGVKLAACVAAPFKAAFDAAASIRVSVDVSVQVQASASASGSASGGASGGAG